MEENRCCFQHAVRWVFSLLLNNKTGHQVLLLRLIRKIISSVEDKWTRGAPLPPAADMLISGRSTCDLSLSEPLTVPTGPWKDPLHRVPVTGLLIKRQEREWPVWTHSQPLCIPPISVSSPFSLFLSLTQSLYLYVAFGLHRSLFRGIRSLCAAQVMLAQMKQNGLFSLSRITLVSLPWPYLFSFPLLNLIFSVQALFNLLSLLSLLCLSFYFASCFSFSHTYLCSHFLRDRSQKNENVVII